MGALSAAEAPATFDSSAYLGALLQERVQSRVERDRDPANERFRRAVRGRVVARRRELGLSQTDVITRLHDAGFRIGYPGYTKWEREMVPLDRVSVLARVLETSPEWILHGDAPQLAELQAHLEQLSAQLAGLERLVVPPESGPETRKRRSA